MRLKILGCRGGIGGDKRRTTSYCINNSVLIDSGTGVGELSLEELSKIDHIVLTHAHWDHISCLPLIPDAVFSMRKKGIRVWALPKVVDIIKQHVFNNHLWPDFTSIQIPGTEEMVMYLNALPEDDSLMIDGLRINKLAAHHGIPACGYRVQQNGSSLAFSGDTGEEPKFWDAVGSDQDLAAVIVECSYPKSLTNLGKMTLHLSSDVIKERLEQLSKDVAAIIIHRKPGYEMEIEQELKADFPNMDIRFPIVGQEYKF